MAPRDEERARIDSALAQVRALRPASDAPLPEFPGYALEHELHRGGQGVVYRARQLSTGRTVALKLLREEQTGTGARSRFEREVAVLATLEHPALVRIVDCGLHSGRFFYAMEYVAGRDLDEELRARPRTLVERVGLLARVAHAVAAAHQRGVLHRDLKPSNIRIDERGEPRLLDFGLARWLRADAPVTELTEAGDFVGSAPWASPEQVGGEAIDARSDVYSLGVVTYQALTGRFPYPIEGPLARIFEAIRSSPPLDARRAAAGIDRDLATILARALEKDPERRYPSALDLARDLERWLAGQPIEARRASLLYVAWKAVRRRPVTSAAGLAALLALVTALWSLASQREKLRDAVASLEARVHADELRRLGEALESGDGRRLAQELATIPASRHNWLVEHHAASLSAREELRAADAERPLALALAPDGDLALGTWQGTVRRLAPDGSERWSQPESLAEVRALAFTPDGTGLLALESRGLDLLDARDGSAQRRFEWEEGGLERLSLSGQRVLLASMSGTVLALSATLSEAPRVLRLAHANTASDQDGPARTGIVLCAVNAAVGRAATVGQGELVLWEVASGTELAREPLLSFAGLAVRALAFAADGSRLALSFPPQETRPGALWILDGRTGRRLHALENLATSADSILLHDERVWVAGAAGAVRELELASGSTRALWPGSGAPLDALLLDAEGQELYLLARSLERVRLLPLRGRPVPVPEGTKNVSTREARGRRAEASGATIRVLEPDGRTRFATALAAQEEVTALCWLEGEELLAAGTSRGRVWFLDERGDLLAEREGPGARIEALAYDPVERTLTVRDRRGAELSWSAR